MKSILTLLIICFFVSCNNNESFSFSKIKAFPERELSSAVFYSIVPLDSPYYKVMWGHKNKDTLVTDTTFSFLGSGAMGYLTSNNHSILFEQECGTNCNYIVVLPFDKKVRPKLFYESIAIDTLNNLIAYVTENDISLFAVENFLTGKQIKVRETNICGSPVKFSCIDSCYFDANSLYLKWSGSNYNGSKKPDWVVKKYSTKEITE